MDIITKFLNGPWMKKAMKLSVDLLHNKKLNETLNKVAAYIKKKGLVHVYEKLELMYNYVSDVVSGKYTDYDMKNLIMILAALIYVATPLDVIPDVVLVAGFSDDIAIACWAIEHVNDELVKYKAWKENR